MPTEAREMAPRPSGRHKEASLEWNVFCGDPHENNLCEFYPKGKRKHNGSKDMHTRYEYKEKIQRKGLVVLNPKDYVPMAEPQLRLGTHLRTGTVSREGDCGTVLAHNIYLPISLPSFLPTIHIPKDVLIRGHVVIRVSIFRTRLTSWMISRPKLGRLS